MKRTRVKADTAELFNYIISFKLNELPNRQEAARTESYELEALRGTM